MSTQYENLHLRTDKKSETKTNILKLDHNLDYFPSFIEFQIDKILKS